jgi:hypothetical protein
MLPQRSIHPLWQGQAAFASSASPMETPVGGVRKSALNITVTKQIYPQAHI